MLNAGSSPRVPDFLVVGAPKAGTTALHRYLLQQPGVFVPRLKEPNHFSADVPTRRRLDRASYLALFEDAPPGESVGEVSVWNLYSRQAAEAIHRLCGPIPILALVRNPLEAIPALHAQFAFNGDEPLDLEAALDAEAQRLRGEGRPTGSWVGPECLCYRQVYRHREQLERYFERFGHDRVEVVLFDDFARDTPGTFAHILRTIGVTEPVAKLDFRAVNTRRQPRNRWLRRGFRRHEALLRRLARSTLPQDDRRHRVGGHLKKILRWATGRRVEHPALPPALWRRLADSMTPEIQSLGTLLDRDLSHWLEPPAPPRA